MSVELIIYGVVAAGLVVWLRSILGTRHGEERTRANPYVAPAASAANDKADKSDTGMPADISGAARAQDAVQDLAENPTDVLSIHDGAVEGVMHIAKVDKTFDVHDFLSKVQDAYAITLESFAEGDVETLAALLDAPVFEAFNHEITNRVERGETMHTDIHAVRKAHILEAYMSGKTAHITVAFDAEETSVTKDGDDKIIAGNANVVNTISDIWVFARDIKSADPRWVVAETKAVH